jgi:hypothetical protein
MTTANTFGNNDFGGEDFGRNDFGGMFPPPARFPRENARQAYRL